MPPSIRWTTILARLENCFGIVGTALDWCRSYLSHRPQCTCVGDAVSKPVCLNYSVPQGSVLGPQWFSMYTYPIRNIVLKHNVSYHIYADDTQIYLAFKPHQQDCDYSINCLQNCVQDIRAWMEVNFLKLNDNKTEFVFSVPVNN